MEAESQARPGVIDRIKTYAAGVIGTTRARIDTFSADVEARILRVVSMLIWTAVAFVCLSLGLTFAMLTVIFGFNLPPLYALGIPALVFLAVGLLGLGMFMKAKRSRPGR